MGLRAGSCSVKAAARTGWHDAAPGCACARSRSSWRISYAPKSRMLLRHVATVYQTPSVRGIASPQGAVTARHAQVPPQGIRRYTCGNSRHVRTGHSAVVECASPTASSSVTSSAELPGVLENPQQQPTGYAVTSPPPQQQHQHQQHLLQVQQQGHHLTILPEHSHLTHLVALSVQDFALVSSCSIRLQPGLTAISGSSGAGKSALLEALGVLLGAPAPPDCVRPPAAAAVIQGSWWLAPAEEQAVRQVLQQAGLTSKALPQAAVAAAAEEVAAAADGSCPGGLPAAGTSPPILQQAAGSSSGEIGGGWLHLRREVCCPHHTSSGTGSSSSSRVFINGVSSSLRVVRRVGEVLVDVNGQAASETLRDSSQQLGVLDRVAGTTHLCQYVSSLVTRLSFLESQLAQVEVLGADEDRAALQRRIDIIHKAGLVRGEDVLLRRRLSSMESRRSCLEAAAAVQAALGGRAGGLAGSSNLSEGVAAVGLQLRGLLSAEEQQQRLLLAERRQLRAATGSNGSSVLQGSPGGAGVVHQGERDECDEYEDEDEDEDEEVVSAAAGVAALQQALDELDAVEEGLRAVLAQLSSYASAVDYSAADAADLSSRLELISKLCRRFRCSRGASGLLDLQQQWQQQLDQYYAAEGQAEAWRVEAQQLQGDVARLALQLSTSRAAAAGRLAAAVQAQLHDLVMSNSRFAVRLDWTPAHASQAICIALSASDLLAHVTQEECSQAARVPAAAHPPLEPIEGSSSQQQQQQQQQPGSQGAAHDHQPSAAASAGDTQKLFRLSPSGLDSVTFLLSAGPSEPLRPLADVASGGEAARVMLALKAAAALASSSSSSSRGVSQHNHNESPAGTAAPDTAGSTTTAAAASPPVLVLDELDAGVGSRLGAPVGRLLQRLVSGTTPPASQVLVVTHTPQVAACASQHIQAVKGPGPDGRIISSFRTLTDTQQRLQELADMMGWAGGADGGQQQQQEGGGDSGDAGGWLAGVGSPDERARQLAAQLLAAAQAGVNDPQQ